MTFIKSAFPPEHNPDQAYFLCFSEDDVFLKSSNDSDPLPLLAPEKADGLLGKGTCFFGWLDGKPCYAAISTERHSSGEYAWCPLKPFYLNAKRGLADVVGYAKQIADWNRNFRFCGRCSSETRTLPGEHARQCPKCRLINYPRLSPAVIAAVIKDDQILLARGCRYVDKEMFSVLAGFLEPGESLEDAVRREILEEVGIEVSNVRYFKSQPWPFPDSVMIGFTADYAGGDIRIDADEIAEARWCRADALPRTPDKRSISGELIQWFVDLNKGRPPHK